MMSHAPYAGSLLRARREAVFPSSSFEHAPKASVNGASVASLSDALDEIFNPTPFVRQGKGFSIYPNDLPSPFSLPVVAVGSRRLAHAF
jgi:hypothetical protein